MRVSWVHAVRLALVAVLALSGALAWSHIAGAADVPASYVASPDVYKIVAENEFVRVIVATWKPGQRDQFHSHPANAVYWLTDCSARLHAPDGKFADFNIKAGFANAQNPIASHSFENRGTTECKVLIVERK